MKFRKKPVIVDAVRLNSSQSSIRECLTFMGQFIALEYMTLQKFSEFCDDVTIYGGIQIETLEGMMKANFGDYIIKGVQGEFYPCKPDIFEQTYEKVEENE